MGTISAPQTLNREVDTVLSAISQCIYLLNYQSMQIYAK